jgi:hypothetical protein
LDQYDTKQPGDLEKGARVIVDVFSREDGAGGVPLRLVLGSDCRAVIEEKCKSTLEYLEKNQEVIDGTDYAERG